MNIGDSESYIVPILIGDAAETVRVSETLWEAGFMVPAIRPPTVAPGSRRLRLSLSSQQRQEDIDALCAALESILKP